MGYIAANCFEKLSNYLSLFSNKKKLCYIQKVINGHPISKSKFDKILTSYLVKSRPQNPVSSVIINFGTTNYFFSNWDLFFLYIKYKHEFKIGIEEKFAAHGYGNIDLKINDYQNNINILRITNISWALELNHNLLNIILLVKKIVEIFLRKKDQLSKIVVNEEIFSLANIIEN